MLVILCLQLALQPNFGETCIIISIFDIFYKSLGTYLEFVERTSNYLVMRRCDDCNSDAIDLTANPVPFGEYHHLVAHVSMKLTVTACMEPVRLKWSPMGQIKDQLMATMERWLL